MTGKMLIFAVFVGALVSVQLVKAMAQKWGWVARPRADRWHSKPTALHGGAGIFPAFILGAVGLYYLQHTNVLSFIDDAGVVQYWALLGGASLMFFTGLADDIWHFKPALKLLLQIIATSLFVFVGGIIELTGVPAFDLALAYFWFLGIINAVNLLDNMDGVSAGVVVLGSLGVWIVGHLGYYDVVPASTWVALLLAAACFGFWLHNKPPASIFMGDSGSLFIGFVFAGITLPSELNLFYGLDQGTSFMERLQPFLIAITLAAIPILDTTLVTVTRLWRGQSPAEGGRDHSTHRLAHSGLSPMQTLIVLYGLSTVCILWAAIMRLSPDIAPLAFSVLIFGFGFAAFYLGCIAVDVEQKRRLGWRQLFESVHHRIPSIKLIIDVPLIVICFYLAYYMRFDFQVPNYHSDPMFYGSLVALVCCIASNIALSTYRFSWRMAAGRDITHYVTCAILGSVSTIAVLAFSTRFSDGHSRGAILIFAFLYFIGLLTSRFSFRFLDDVLLKFRNVRDRDKKVPVVIYGAGRAGRLVSDYAAHLKELSNYRIVAFVDDNAKYKGKRHANTPVVEPAKLSKNAFTNGRAEIWVSSDQISDDRAAALAQEIGSHTIIRRLKISMPEVHYGR